MSNELVIHYPTGNTLYVLLMDKIGQIYNGAAFEAPQSANWATYDIAMSECAVSTQIYRATMPAVAAGPYSYAMRKQAGGAPAVSDIIIGAGRIDWSGTAEVSIGSMTLGVGAIDATTIAIGGANKIADHVLRRNTDNIEASAHGDALDFKSLYGATSKLTHKVNIDGTDLDTYKSDDIVVLGTQALTTDAGAEPVVTVG